MGLKIKLETRFGDFAEYWRIGGVLEDYDAKQFKVVLLGYHDRTARVNQKVPKEGREYILPQGVLPVDSDRAAVYKALLKHIPELATAESVDEEAPA